MDILLHRQVPRSKIPIHLLPLWEGDNALAFDLSWPCWLYYINQGPCPDYTDLDLSGRNLQEAWLWGANLYQANLRGADLERADFLLANLSEANLAGANLQGAYFFGANLQAANFSGAFRPSNPPPGWEIVNFILHKK